MPTRNPGAERSYSSLRRSLCCRQVLLFIPTELRSPRGRINGGGQCDMQRFGMRRRAKKLRFSVPALRGPTRHPVRPRSIASGLPIMPKRRRFWLQEGAIRRTSANVVVSYFISLMKSWPRLPAHNANKVRRRNPNARNYSRHPHRSLVAGRGLLGDDGRVHSHSLGCRDYPDRAAVHSRLTLTFRGSSEGRAHSACCHM